MPRNPYYDATRSHHRPDGFQNNDLEFAPKTLAEVLRWRWDATCCSLPLPPCTPIPSVQRDLAFISSNAPDCQLFFVGDTGYSRDFIDIRKRLAEFQEDQGFDIALLPVGACEPRWFISDQHVNVTEALKIHRGLGAQRSLGVHWGTFQLTDEALDEPPRRLAAERHHLGIDEDNFFVLAVGQTKRLPPRRCEHRSPQPV